MFIRDGDDRGQRRRFSRRAALLGLGQLGALSVVAARLHQLQVLDQARYALLADDNRMAYRTLAPERGRILDRNGIVLADNEEYFRLLVTPTFSGPLKPLLARLAGYVSLSAEEQDRVIARAKQQPASWPLVVATDLSFEQVAAINIDIPDLPGVETEIAWRRRYHHSATTNVFVGFVGAVERLAIDDDPAIRLPGMRIGKSGVELAMEQRLRGTGGTLRQETDARGRIIRTLDRTEPERGGDVTLTVPIGLQASVMTRVGQERRAALVALDVDTGAILAMASAPHRDQSGLKSEDWKRIEDAPDDPLFNRALLGQYPPGSTYKMVTALAALEAGKVSIKERIDCEGTYRYADQSYRCWNRSGHGPCDLVRALRESCDCYFYEIARRTGIMAMSAMAQRLGFGQTFGNGIARQRAGVAPTPDWKRGRFGRPWHGGETILAGIGQGYVLATPLQLAVMTARIASGKTVNPRLIFAEDDRIVAADAEALQIDPAHLTAVRAGMIAAVNDDAGTGHNAQVDSDSLGRYVEVAGKTGTSQVHRRSTDRRSETLDWEHRDHALFVGYAPARAPRFAVAGVVEHGGSGGRTAAPLVRDAFSFLLADAPATLLGTAGTRRG